MQSKFIYTAEFERRIEQSISSERLSSYRGILPGNDNFERTIELYTANMALGEALFGPIQIMEVALRNSIAAQLANFYQPDWFTDNRVGFDKQSLRTLTNAVARYRNNPAHNTTELLGAKVIAELPLGFWTHLFTRRHEDPLWRQCLRKAFPHVGGPLTRNTVHSSLDEVRRLRNRIVHHEQIIKYPLDDLYNRVITIVTWVDPVVAIWLSHHNRYHEVKDSFSAEVYELVGRNETADGQSAT